MTTRMAKTSGRKALQSKKCLECHSPLKSEGKVKKLKLAFHRNCKNCHKDLAKKGLIKEAPFRKCRAAIRRNT